MRESGIREDTQREKIERQRWEKHREKETWWEIRESEREKDR